jgi:hypothetical protein
MRHEIPMPEEKPLEWMGSSHDDICELPHPVRQTFGRALFQAQIGETSRNAKALQGFGGAGILEVVDDYDRSTFRAVYTVRKVLRSTSCMSSRRRVGRESRPQSRISTPSTPGSGRRKPTTGRTTRGSRGE